MHGRFGGGGGDFSRPLITFVSCKHTEMRSFFAILTIVVLLVSCGGRNAAREAGASAKTAAGTTVSTGETPAAASPAPAPARPAPVKQYTYRVVKEYPHDPASYTQGLFWHDGYIYEGTGQYGESRLMKVELETGKAVKTVELDKRYFGEGVAWHKGRIYQLTWMQKRAFVYNGATFEQIGTLSYSGEGWGITSDGERLYTSDGTSTISVRNPENFAVERTIPVTMGRNRRNLINELEWVEGEIWANVYTTDMIVRIDPQTGFVTGVIDFEGIQAEEDYRPGVTDYFNGIAYDPDTGNIFVTGKYWNKLYHVEVMEKK